MMVERVFSLIRLPYIMNVEESWNQETRSTKQHNEKTLVVTTPDKRSINRDSWFSEHDTQLKSLGEETIL